ncbi:CBS domain-containing protein [Streptomyces sp. NPDC060243]|uniref:CBS domain-containing protein n=1 Tax=Streptomyces sp. NPDC060243 TaxID=3347081 RepID=UPI00365191C7
MRPVQSQPCPALVATVRASDDPTAAAGPQVWDAMTVEVALSLMTAARTRHLVICDEDGRRTGQVTLARLTHVSGSPGYTDRTRLRDVHDDAAAEAGPPARHQPREARPPAARLPAPRLPAADEDGVRGALAASR